jgi:aspartate racemase
MRIGIIGGLGPEATIEYYRIIVQRYKEETGRFPEISIDSLDMSTFACQLNKNVDEDVTTSWLLDALQRLKRAGADVGLIASNTPHIVFDAVARRSPIPLISIVEETCREAERLSLKKLGLFGTRVTMQADFYQKNCARRGIMVMVPTLEEQDYIHEKLVNEVMLNKIIDTTRQHLLAIIQRMIDRGAIDGIILGCTELPLILTRDAFGIPFLNTTRIHAESVVQYCLKHVP